MSEEKGKKETAEETEKPKLRDRWEITQIIGQLFLPIVIAAVGGTYTIYQNSQAIRRLEEDTRQANAKLVEQRDIDKKKLMADRVLAMVKNLSSDNKTERLLTVATATNLIKMDQLPTEMLEVLRQVSVGDKDPEVQASAQNSIKIAAETVSKNPEQNLMAQQVYAKTNTQAKTEVEKLPARVYLQVQKDTNRDLAINLQAKLIENNLKAPGIEGVEKAPEITEIRYFKGENSEADLEQIKKVLKGLGISYKEPADLSDAYPEAKVRPRHYEVWLGKNTVK